MLILSVGLRDLTLKPGASPEEVLWLQSFLTFDTMDWAGGKGPRAATVPLTNRDGSIPGGLLPLIETAARRDGVRLSVEDSRARPVEPAWNADLDWLYDYQREAVDAVLRNVRGILKIATGGGKGEMITALTRAIPARWTMLVHRTHLMRDLADRFEKRCGEQAGRIGEGEWSQRRVTFASMATVYEQRNTPEAAALFGITQGLLADEAHVVPAGTFSEVTRRFAGAYWRIGTTATPFGRSDRRSIYTVANLGPLIYDLDAAALIAMSRIAKPDLRMITCPHHGDELASMPWPKLYKTAIVDNPWRNALLVRAAVTSPGPRMVFVQELAHGRNLLALLKAQGLRTSFAEGVMPTRDRENLIADLCEGRTDCAVATGVFNEGVNIRNLRTVVIGAGGKSPIAALQRIGRATRMDAASGKTTCTAWDILDTGHPTLAQHARARRQAYVSEGYEVTTSELPLFGSPQGSLPGL